MHDASYLPLFYILEGVNDILPSSHFTKPPTSQFMTRRSKTKMRINSYFANLINKNANKASVIRLYS